MSSSLTLPQKINDMREIKENSVKLLTNEVLTKQLLKLYKNRIKLWEIISIKN